MYKILTLNSISPLGLERLDKGDFTVGDAIGDPDGILVRSASLLDGPLPAGLLAIARAGAGYNNIPVDKCSENGIVVFNTPGANANAVKELVLAGLFMSSRRIAEGIEWIKTLRGRTGISALVEKEKGRFAGPEIAHKTVGVVGLGAIGVLVANACEALDMKVIGYDPYLSVDAAWALSRNVEKATDLVCMLKQCDYVTIHMPLSDATKGMFDASLFRHFKKGARLLNFARGGIVDDASVKRALADGTLTAYVTDFPSDDLIGVDGLLAVPHLGASTPEAEDNCAVMAARQLKHYLLYGHIRNSVNLPDCDLGKERRHDRLAIVNRNVPNVVGPVTTVLAENRINIEDMINRSKGDYAYNLIDISGAWNDSLAPKIRAVPGVIRVRRIAGRGRE